MGVRGYLSAYDAARASSSGASTPCPAIRRTASSTPSSPRRRRPGTASGGSAAAAARCGTRWPTIPSSTRSTSAPATARRGRATSARRAAATTSFSRRSSRWIPTPGGSGGTTRPRPPRTGLHRHAAHHAGRAARGRKTRKVLMQAPKNGFFYVLDRVTGELISADKFRAGHVGQSRRHEDRTPGRDRDRELQPRDAPDRPGTARCAQLATDGLQSTTGLVYIRRCSRCSRLAVGGLQEDRQTRRRDMFWNPGIDWNTAIDTTRR